MSIFKMAWRNIWRNTRRSLVTMGAMAFALLAMILYSGLAQGMLEGLERNILDMELGDLQIFAPQYRKKPQVYTRLAEPEALVSRLEQAGYRAAPRLLASGLAAAGESSAGVAFRGIEVARDARVSLVYKQVAQGRWLDAKDPQGVVLGRQLAKNLAVKPGDEIVVLTQGSDGSMANDLFRVRGVLRGVSEAVDRGGVYMTAAAFRQLLVLPDGAQQIIVRRQAGQTLAQALAAVQQLAPEQDVRSWRQLMPTLASMLDASRGSLYAMFLIIYLAIGLVILNAMLMAVFERIREFGVLKAVGMEPWMVLRLVLTESGIQTALAVAAGCLLSLPGAWYLATRGIDLQRLGGISLHGISWDSVWRASFAGETFVGPVVTLVLIVSIAVLYPAIKAALISPLAAIQHR